MLIVPMHIYAVRVIPENGGPSTIGRLEIYNAGEWGSVCDRGWDQLDAIVACVRMGYQGGNMYTNTAGPGSGTVWLADLECTGAETSLKSCTHSAWGVTDNYCRRHDNDAGIMCYTHSGSSVYE